MGRKLKKLVILISLFTLVFVLSLSVDAREITRNDIEPKVKNFVINHYKPLYKGKIEVTCGRMAGVPFNVPDGKLKVKVTSILRDTFLQRTIIRVSVYVDGKIQRSMGIPVTLALYDNVWVATQPILRDDAISAVNVKVVKRDISRMARTAARASTDLSGTRAKKTFRAGDILDHRFIEKDPVVIRNALVEIIFQSKNISIAIPGRAMENGHIGDVIKVKSKEFNKEYVGKVVDRGLILVNI